MVAEIVKQRSEHKPVLLGAQAGLLQEVPQGTVSTRICFCFEPICLTDKTPRLHGICSAFLVPHISPPGNPFGCEESCDLTTCSGIQAPQGAPLVTDGVVL